MADGMSDFFFLSVIPIILGFVDMIESMNKLNMRS